MTQTTALPTVASIATAVRATEMTSIQRDHYRVNFSTKNLRIEAVERRIEAAVDRVA